MWILLALLGLCSANPFRAQAITARLPANSSIGVYLNPQTGRFWTMDSFEGSQNKPLSLHKYLYCQANPTDMVDLLGKWASKAIAPIHQIAIKRCLGGFLPEDDITILCDMQVEMDTDQSAVKSYLHAMSDGQHAQFPEEAKQAANNFVRGRLADARDDERKGSKSEHTSAMKELGRAIHTLQDSTSPAHHGFKSWYDYTGGAFNPCEWIHASKELIYPGTGSWLELSTYRAYLCFTGTHPMPSDFFGDLGVDTLGDELFHHFRTPSAQTMSISDTVGGLGTFAF
jgi:hypothetical protein